MDLSHIDRSPSKRPKRSIYRSSLVLCKYGDEVHWGLVSSKLEVGHWCGHMIDCDQVTMLLKNSKFNMQYILTIFFYRPLEHISGRILILNLSSKIQSDRSKQCNKKLKCGSQLMNTFLSSTKRCYIVKHGNRLYFTRYIQVQISGTVGRCKGCELPSRRLRTIGQGWHKNLKSNSWRTLLLNCLVSVWAMLLFCDPIFCFNVRAQLIVFLFIGKE